MKPKPRQRTNSLCSPKVPSANISCEKDREQLLVIRSARNMKPDALLAHPVEAIDDLSLRIVFLPLVHFHDNRLLVLPDSAVYFGPESGGLLGDDAGQMNRVEDVLF